jgi:DNA topoisomerase II
MTSSQKYKKFTQLEHVLARPGMYVGSTENDDIKQWVVGNDGKMVERLLTFSPGLFKIFDEILVNAIDHSANESNMVDRISVEVDKDSGVVSVTNTGGGIPVEIHDQHKMYVPELIFGNLMTSSNYDDTQERVVGGTNGYGSKLTNIFSTSFTVETADIVNKKVYTQEWKDNMSVCGKPTIKRYTKTKGYTKITFLPDYKRFRMKTMTEDVFKLFERRTYDCTATTGDKIKVYFNGTLLNLKNFDKYAGLYLSDDTKRTHETSADGRWDVIVSTTSNQSFRQVSFVNGIHTSLGGSHVDAVMGNIVRKVGEHIALKHKNLTVKPSQIKDNLFVFLRSTIVNPAFSSQTKTELTTRFRDFGSRYDPSDDFVKKIMKLGFVDDLIALVKHKEMRELNKTDGKKTSRVRVENLEDANLAGTSRSHECTLILTEGLSAKTFAISGLSVIKRDLFGVFPLKGKLLNVREATVKQLQTNEEILNIKKILGLQHDKKYSNGSSDLRYGKVMILTDADTDGSHIKGLFMNMIHTWWPELLKHDFITSMRTPIVKVTRGSTSLSFYNMPDYRNWTERNGGTSGYNVKYYKGLGTSTSHEAKEIFMDFQKNFVRYNYEDGQDKDMLLAFKKTLADDRKAWIKEGTRKNEVLDVQSANISVHDFIHKDLIWFSIADNVRSIPNVMDGLKPSQRKVLYSCRKRPNNNESKVSQLSGYVSSTTSYHHGEQSLMGTIINMAQDFVGSNNMNLLMPVGQFGTRLVGGKDAASPRYIFTKLSEAATRMFHKHDDNLLTYLEDDGTKIEPEYYLPTLPIVLINGTEGIGTGYSTSVPCFNPKDVETNVLRLLEGTEPHKMTPWYRGFKGTIEEVSEGKYACHGVYEKVGANTIKITELPIGKWTSDYKEYLEQLVEKGFVKSFTNDSTESEVSFTLKVGKDVKDLISDLKLTTTLNTTNMHLFDAKNTMRKYTSPDEILKEFVKVKLDAYKRRKELLLSEWSDQETVLGYKVKFILQVMDDTIHVFRKSQAEITKQLKHHAYPAHLHDTLLGIRLYSFTSENVDKIENDLKQKRQEIAALKRTSVPDMWKHDLAS